MHCCERYNVERQKTRHKHHILVSIRNVPRDMLKFRTQVMNESTELWIRYLWLKLDELDMTRLRCNGLWWILQMLSVLLALLYAWRLRIILLIFLFRGNIKLRRSDNLKEDIDLHSEWHKIDGERLLNKWILFAKWYYSADKFVISIDIIDNNNMRFLSIVKGDMKRAVPLRIFLKNLCVIENIGEIAGLLKRWERRWFSVT